MVKQESHEICNLVPITSSPLKRAFVNQFAILVSQAQILKSAQAFTLITHNRFVRSEYKLLLQLSQFKDVFRFTRLDVDLCKESTNHLDHFR